MTKCGNDILSLIQRGCGNMKKENDGSLEPQAGQRFVASNWFGLEG